MHSQISLHRIKDIKARAYLDLQSTPLIVEFESIDSEYCRSEIILHLEDAGLAALLVEAINGAVAKCAAEKQIAVWVTDETGLIDSNIMTGEQRA